jgi:hypothetical protein
MLNSIHDQISEDLLNLNLVDGNRAERLRSRTTLPYHGELWSHRKAENGAADLREVPKRRRQRLQVVERNLAPVREAQLSKGREDICQ